MPIKFRQLAASLVAFILVATALVGGTATSASAVTNQWAPLASGLASSAYGIARDATTGKLAATTADRHVWEWDGTSWTDLGDIGAGTGRAQGVLYMSNGDLLAGYGPECCSAAGGGVKRWDGTTWTNLFTTTGGDGNNGRGNLVRSIISANGKYYFGGGFTSFTPNGGAATAVNTFVIEWDGNSTFAPVGSSGVGNAVFGLDFIGTDIYASTGDQANSGEILKWNGAAWSAVGPNFGSSVYGLDAVSASEIYAVGSFTTAGGAGLNYAAQWNGTSWSSLAGANAPNAFGNAVAVQKVGSTVYIAGSIDFSRGVQAWDATNGWVTPDGFSVSGGQALLIDPAGNVFLVGTFAAGSGTVGSWSAKAGVLLQGADPTVATVSPSSGSTAGGTEVTITGTNFATGATVEIGGVECTVTQVTATTIKCTTTAHAAGVTDVVVTLVTTQSVTKSNAYTYVTAPTVTTVSPNKGTTAGGTDVTITGTNFANGSTVKIGGTTCAVKSVTATKIVCTTGAHSAGTVNVVVTSSGQTATKTNGYTYETPTPSAPTISAVSPPSGTTAGGTIVTITGTNFANGATVKIGGKTCTVKTRTATKITCATSAHSAGKVDVVVTSSGQSVTKADAYTYVAPDARPCPLNVVGARPSSARLPVGVPVILVQGIQTVSQCRVVLPHVSIKGDARPPVVFRINYSTGRVVAIATRPGALAALGARAVPVRAPYAKQSANWLRKWRS